MAEELNTNTEEEVVADNSKEWAASFTVDGVQYAASIFWESLQNIQAPFLDAKEASENVLVGADLFCVKHGKSPQMGLAISSQGFKKGMNAAAVTAVTSMSDASSLLAVFKVDAGYWYLCVRNDVILSDGDILFVNEEDAKEQFLSMLSVPDWAKKIAPADWNIDETEQKDISEIFAGGLNSKLEKINALRGNELLIVVVLGIAVVAWLIMYLTETYTSTAEPTPQRVVTRRAQPKVVKQVENITVAPWEDMIDPVWFMDMCRKSVLDLSLIPVPGWSISGISCSNLSAITSWRREFGRLSWIELALANSGLTFVNKVIDTNSSSITVSLPFPEPKKITSVPDRTEVDLRHMINDLFQAMNLSINLGRGTTKVNDKTFNYITFSITSRYDPDVWKSLLTKFSGLRINNMLYNNGTWNYEGLIYVQ